jgi:peroxiredoxin
MSTRWTTVAAAGVILVAGLAIGYRTRRSDDIVAAGRGCGPNAQPANLNFTLKDMNGKDLRLADLKGKVILLNFWATWCGPCQMEIPEFVQLQAKYKTQGLAVVGVSVDDPPEKLPPFARQFKVNYPLLVGQDRTDIQDAYGPIFGIPVTVLIGRDGTICKKHLGPATLEQFESEVKALM